MAFPGSRGRGRYVFIGGFLAAGAAALCAGAWLSVPFLVLVSVLLMPVEGLTFLYVVFNPRAGTGAAFTLCAIPCFLIVTWLTVAVTVFGFLR